MIASQILIALCCVGSDSPKKWELKSCILNLQVEKLKDLCLKQREEIKSLKNAILFPDVMNSQLQELLEKQGSELKQAKVVIPALQQQVFSLTGQLQTLAEDLAEVHITCILVYMPSNCCHLSHKCRLLKLDTD